MDSYGIIALLLGVRDRLRRQIRLEEFYRRGQPKPDPTVVIDGTLYALAPRVPSKLRDEVRAIERAVEVIRLRHRIPKPRARAKPRLVSDVEIEGLKEPNPFSPRGKP